MGGFSSGGGGGGGGGSITTQSVVTGLRALGTVYQNAGTKPLFVSVTVNGGATAMGIVGYTDTSAAPTTIVCSTTNSFSGCVVFWVLPGSYYKVTASNSTSFLWVEWI